MHFRPIPKLYIPIFFVFACSLQFISPALEARQKHTTSPRFLANENDVATLTEAKHLVKKTENLDPKVLQLALKAQSCAKSQGLTQSNLLTIIDYSRPSTEKRLWIFDLERGKALYETFVAHGKNSGLTQASHFSDRPESLQSSIGIYTTGQIYQGGHGQSLQLHGKEPGFNGHAFSRHIVMHGASYVNEEIVRAQGYLGRSWGCPAISEALIRPIINLIKGGSLIFAYYPDQNWLSSSKFLHCGDS